MFTLFLDQHVRVGSLRCAAQPDRGKIGRHWREDGLRLQLPVMPCALLTSWPYSTTSA